MFKLSGQYAPEKKEELMKEMCRKLSGLEGKIDELKEIKVHCNSEDAPTTNYDILLDTSFNSIEDLNAYQVHEEHQKVVGFVKSIKVERACLDFEY